MKITAWRVCKRKYSSTMWTGLGARLVAGRWHNKGTSVVYVSGSLSLAALELLVHLDTADVLFDFAKCPIVFDHSLVTRVDVAKLPRNWRNEPSPASLRSIGDRFISTAKTPVLAVPSVVVPEEWNYILNPNHPEFRRLQIGKVQRFKYDPRLA